VNDAASLQSFRAIMVQTPKHANPGGRLNVIQMMAHDDPGLLQKIAEAAGCGELKIPIARTFALSELAKTHQPLAGNPRSKILVRH
jgi:hypothetical protein